MKFSTKLMQYSRGEGGEDGEVGYGEEKQRQRWAPHQFGRTKLTSRHLQNKNKYNLAPFVQD